MLTFMLILACSPKDAGDTADEDPPFGTELARTEIPPASSLWVDTVRAFACAGSDGVYVLDIADPNAPFLEETVSVECLALDGESGRVHVAAGAYGMRTVHPGNLTLIGAYETDFPVTALTVDAGESQAWIAGSLDDGTALGVEGVLTYSVENLTMNKRADLDPGAPAALAYDRRGVFVARTEGWVDLLGLAMDVRSSFELLGPLAGGGGGGLLAIDEVLWAAQGDAGLVGYDISSLEEPLPLWSASEAAWGLASIEDRLYVGTDQALIVLDIGDPAAPTEVGRVDLTDVQHPEGIYILDGKAWITDAQDGNFVIVSIDEDAT